MSVTKSESYNIISPEGNSLAVFVDVQDGVLKLKDVKGVVEDLSVYTGNVSPYKYDPLNTDNTGIIPVKGNANSATGILSVIGGGEENISSGQYSTISGGITNEVLGGRSAIGGGSANKANGFAASVGGGEINWANNSYSRVGGGQNNRALGQYSNISGGQANIANGDFSAISGGSENQSNASNSFIGGGNSNNASGDFSSILGGKNNDTNELQNTHIVGSDIVADRQDCTFVNNLSIKNIPTSSVGLPSGSIWSNAGILTIVP